MYKPKGFRKQKYIFIGLVNGNYSNNLYIIPKMSSFVYQPTDKHQYILEHIVCLMNPN